jgi:hypothetical protein
LFQQFIFASMFRYPFRRLLLLPAFILTGCVHPVGTVNPVFPPQQQSHGSGPDYPRIPITDFTKTWSGKEGCSDSSFENMNMVITVRDSFSVFISGCAGRTTPVQGDIKGYAIFIARQALQRRDVSLDVEGKLVLANNRQVLSCYLKYYKDGQVDTCVSHLTQGAVNTK